MPPTDGARVRALVAAQRLCAFRPTRFRGEWDPRPAPRQQSTRPSKRSSVVSGRRRAAGGCSTTTSGRATTAEPAGSTAPVNLSAPAHSRAPASVASAPAIPAPPTAQPSAPVSTSPTANSRGYTCTANGCSYPDGSAVPDSKRCGVACGEPPTSGDVQGGAAPGSPGSGTPRSCGNATTPTGRSVAVSVKQGTTTCATALSIVQIYYQKVPTQGQGSNSALTVNGWNCISEPAAVAIQTGHAGGCTSGGAVISLETLGSP